MAVLCCSFCSEWFGASACVPVDARKSATVSPLLLMLKLSVMSPEFDLFPSYKVILIGSKNLRDILTFDSIAVFLFLPECRITCETSYVSLKNIVTK